MSLDSFVEKEKEKGERINSGRQRRENRLVKVDKPGTSPGVFPKPPTRCCVSSNKKRRLAG